ncbi:MAG TPA: NlpC/P60 family protein [Denitromonas sp.]|nr:NlpC/P60 family protein [Denitromonas sp.]
MTALDIIEAAAECIGVPFRHQGRSIEPGPGQGIDCVGLAVHVARSLGLEYIDRTGYSRSPNGTDLQDTLDAQPCLLPIKRSDVQPGDLLLMRFKAAPQHVAIYAGPTIIHSYEQPGLCCEQGFSEAWARRVVSVYRFVEAGR